MTKITTLKEIENSCGAYECIANSDFYESDFNELIFFKPINFENKKLIDLNYQITIKEIFSGLLEEIRKLKERIEDIEKDKHQNDNKILIAQGSLREMWDNEKDDLWADL